MAEFPGDTGYPAHIPPQHAPRLQERRRKQKPPASLSKLHRPLVSYSETSNQISSPKKRKIINKNTNPKTRFYCNDCKKKFRSRILANRNNNAVQHYCSLYSKIITRKVDSHSNKCKGDHGMGPCVVKRTDNDPDSDGEDETKAAYYADKGKKRPSSRKSSGAYTKKRKRDDNTNNNTPTIAKRQRRNDNNNNNNNMVGMPPPMISANDSSGQSSQIYYPPLPGGYNGYYNSNGYMSPHYNGNGYHNGGGGGGTGNTPPPIQHQSSSGSTPPLMGSIYENENGNINMITHRDIIHSRIDDIPPPPPPLEEIEPMKIENIDDSNDVDNKEKVEEVLVCGDKDIVEVNDNIAGIMVNTNGNENGNTNTNVHNDKVESNDDVDNKQEVNKDDEEDEECINDENTEEDDDLPDLTVPCESPVVNNNGNVTKRNDNGGDDEDNEGDDQDDDLMLTVPQ
eukprot:923314_1